MKKIILAVLIATTSLVSLSSCTKEYITNNNYLPGVTYIATIFPNTWTLTHQGERIYDTTIPFPELDQQYFNFGTVQVAIQLAGSNSYNTIPATINGIHYSYEYFVGKIIVYAEVRSNLNINDENDLDFNIKTKVTLTDAENGG